MTPSSINQFVTQYAQKPEVNAPFALENPHLLELNLSGSVWAKLGSMVAYQGVVEFERESSLNRGWGQFFLRRLTVEQATLMRIRGSGRVYLADKGKRVQLLSLKNESLFVNGTDVLAFDSSIDSKITMMRSLGSMMGSGLFNMHLKGSGNLAITTHHTPIVLMVTPNRPLHTDPQATVAWSSDLQVDMATNIQLKTLVGRGSGESFQMRFKGNGWVLIQPYEEALVVR